MSKTSCLFVSYSEKSLQSFVICLSKDIIGSICIFTRSSLQTHGAGCTPHSRCSLQTSLHMDRWQLHPLPIHATKVSCAPHARICLPQLQREFSLQNPPSPALWPGTDTASIPSSGPEQGSGVGDRKKCPAVVQRQPTH